MKEGINAGHGDRSAGMLQPIIKNVLEKIEQDMIITFITATITVH